MPIDPSIALGIQRPKFAGPQDVISLQNMLTQGQLHNVQLKEAQRQERMQTSLQDIFKNHPDFIDPEGTVTPEGLKAVYGVDPGTGMKIQQQSNQQNMFKAQLNHMGLQNQAATQQIEDARTKRLGMAHNNQTKAYVSAYDLAKNAGASEEKANELANTAWNQQLMQDQASGLMSGVTPEQISEVAARPRSINEMRALITDPQEVAKQKQKEIEAAQHERTTQVAERRAAALESRPEPVTTVQVADPKDPNKTIVINARNGDKIGDAPPKNVADKALPASAAQKLFENQQNMRKAQVALELIEGKGDPNATGVKGYLPDSILQRTDPNGVETRAAIADLGSMIIHDRSGAAVTASEYPRLKPFIPTVTDDAETVKKKLKRFVQVYGEIVEDSSEFYRESGYKVPEMKSSGKTMTDVSGAEVKPMRKESTDSGKSLTYEDAEKEKRYQEWKKANGK